MVPDGGNPAESICTQAVSAPGRLLLGTALAEAWAG
jgi:hypothetical protein